jgi:hypothetical protein
MSANPWRRALAAGDRAALAFQGSGRREVQAVGGPAAGAGDRAGCRPGRVGVACGSVLDAGHIAEVIRARFRLQYTLAGVDLLLHRIG